MGVRDPLDASRRRLVLHDHHAVLLVDGRLDLRPRQRHDDRTFVRVVEIRLKGRVGRLHVRRRRLAGHDHKNWVRVLALKDVQGVELCLGEVQDGRRAFNLLVLIRGRVARVLRREEGTA